LTLPHQFNRSHSICQEPAPFTLSIPLAHTSARPVEPLVLPNPSSNHSSTTRQVSNFSRFPSFRFHLIFAPSRELYSNVGHLTESLLDMFLSQIYFKNQVAAAGMTHPAHLPLSDVLSIVIDSFTSATERHIEVSSCLPLFHSSGCLQHLSDLPTSLTRSVMV
jgi:hypothetical protein